VAADDVADEIDAEAAASEESQETPVKSSFPAADEEAELLDEDSADPEIQLDLARAYISMGDKEAARVILEEVIAHGSEDQQAEASKMKDFL
jgi:pilus assembly protein FimV